ncbi:ATP-dependent Clp protease ATP-binding subunit [Candidatus Obscuribacterales bacterium]|nr:ATP-dependent Clp protease ATP-binding subunit [Candidatus Obscuribacterales bacterium]
MNTRTNNAAPERELPFVVVNLDTMTPAEEQYAERFDSRLIGQPEARQIALDVRAKYRNPLRNKEYPLGVYYCVGKSRRGKSLLAQVLAELFHGNKKALTRITAEDYLDDSQMSDLTGATPKYVGYRAPVDVSKMSSEELAKTDGYSKVSQWNRTRVRLGSKEFIDVVVIEEFEKSGYDFFKFWMEIFDKGAKTLGNGEECDFSNTVFILTSNIGMERVEREEKGGIGFTSTQKTLTHKEIVNIVSQEMKRAYKPEFRNRLDGVVVFRELSNEDVAKIVDVEVDKIEQRIVDQMPRGQDFTLDVQASAREFLLAKTGGEVAELKRVIETHVMTSLGRMLDPDNEERIQGGDLVRVNWDGKSDKLTFAIARGHGDVDGNLEGLKLYGGDTAGSLRGLSLQRRVARARMQARREAEKEWNLVLTFASKDEFEEEAPALIHDVKSVFEIRVKGYAIMEEAPYSVTLMVVASDDQIKLAKELYPELEAKPITRALVPVKK